MLLCPILILKINIQFPHSFKIAIVTQKIATIVFRKTKKQSPINFLSFPPPTNIRVTPTIALIITTTITMRITTTYLAV